MTKRVRYTLMAVAIAIVGGVFVVAPWLRINLLRALMMTTAVLTFGFTECSAQVSTEQTYLTHFLERPPAPAELDHVPTNARDIIVAKVRLFQQLAYLGRRDQSGAPPPPPADLFYAGIEIVTPLRGNTRAGDRQEVYFGIPGGRRNYKYPIEPPSREYFVASYVTPEGKRRLLEFQISEEEYRAWETTRFQRPGAEER